MSCDDCGHEDSRHGSFAGCAGIEDVQVACRCVKFKPSKPSPGRGLAVIVASLLTLIGVVWSVLRWGWM